jgi:hypothetical protein
MHENGYKQWDEREKWKEVMAKFREHFQYLYAHTEETREHAYNSLLLSATKYVVAHKTL